MLIVTISVMATLLLMLLVSHLPGAEIIPLHYWIFGAVCPALISAPITLVMARQAEANRVLNNALTKAYMTMKQLAETDQLTGVSNRAAFFTQAIALHDNAAGWFLIIDVDHFKTVNDIPGHETGDMALRAIAGAISASIRPIDLVCRLGGEEFAAYLAAADKPFALEMAETIRTAIERLHVINNNGAPAQLTASIGLSDGDGCSVQDAMRSADVAMYRAKQEGRNRVRVLA